MKWLVLMLTLTACVDTAIDACARGCERNGGRMAAYTREGGCTCTAVHP